MNIVDENTIHLSVRELVEFVLNAGDIDNRRTGPAVLDAMTMRSKWWAEVGQQLENERR